MFLLQMAKMPIRTEMMNTVRATKITNNELRSPHSALSIRKTKKKNETKTFNRRMLNAISFQAKQFEQIEGFGQWLLSHLYHEN